MNLNDCKVTWLVHIAICDYDLNAKRHAPAKGQTLWNHAIPNGEGEQILLNGKQQIGNLYLLKRC